MPWTLKRWDGVEIVTFEDVDNERDAVIKAVKLGVDLYRASLDRASLVGARLDGASLNWSSHDTLAEILFRDAGEDVERRMVAGLILISRDWCWEDFAKIEHPQREWAIAELAKRVQDGDNAPALIRNAIPKTSPPQRVAEAV